MKSIILLLMALMVCSSIYSKSEDTDKQIKLKGKYGFASTNSVKVEIGNNTLTATFNKDVDNVIITVKKKTGEVISNQVVDAKEFDTVPVQINNYKPGECSIEISSPEGVLEGEF